MQTMYPGKVNSPATTLDGGINDTVETINVVDGSVLPNSPNIAVIGTGEDAETILYNTKVNNILSNVTRGFQGVAKAWNSGEAIARLFTEYDYKSLKDNINTIEARKISDFAEVTLAELIAKISDIISVSTGAHDNDKMVTQGYVDDVVVGDGVPTGSIIAFGAAAAPTDWLLCNGAAVSRVTYSTLFGIISTTYGIGDGSTTFNLPDLKGKVPVGLDAGQAEFDALAEVGGEKTHTLIIAEIPPHVHTIATKFESGLIDIDSGTAADASKNTGSTGGGGAHNNLQPYLVINYIIKT